MHRTENGPAVRSGWAWPGLTRHGYGVGMHLALVVVGAVANRQWGELDWLLLLWTFCLHLPLQKLLRGQAHLWLDPLPVA